jgi:hypothetical protein
MLHAPKGDVETGIDDDDMGHGRLLGQVYRGNMAASARSDCLSSILSL